MMVVDGSNLRQIGVAMFNYSYDHDGMLPAHPRDAVEYLDEIALDEQVWLGVYHEEDLPADRGDFDGPATRFGGYVFLNLGLDLDDIEKPGVVILAYTAMPTSHQVQRNVLFADGHTERWEEDVLRASLPEGVDVDALDGP